MKNFIAELDLNIRNVLYYVYINVKGKFIQMLQEQRQGLRFKVSFKGLATELDILIRSPIQVLTKANVA